MVKCIRQIRSFKVKNLVRGNHWFQSEGETLLKYNLKVDWNDTPGFLWYDYGEDCLHPIMRSPLGDDDGRAYSTFHWRQEGCAPKVPPIAIPHYDPNLESLSIRTPVSPLGEGALPPGSPSVAVASVVSTSIPAAHVSERPPMNAKEITPAPFPASGAHVAPLPSRRVMDPVAATPTTGILAVVPATPAPSVHATAAMFSVPAFSPLLVPVTVSFPVPVPARVAAVQATPLSIALNPIAAMD